MTALVKAHPSNLWQEDPAVINLKSLRKPYAISRSSLLEHWHVLHGLVFIKAIHKGSVQILQLLLQYLRGALLQKTILFRSFPQGEPESQFIVPQDRLPLLQPIHVHGQGFIPEKP